MNLPSVLVIDDEPDNFDVIETLLSDRDYQLYYAASGQEALSTLNTFDPNLILLDVMMPEMDGIEVCQRIKTMPQWQSVPIIMVTALTAKEDLAHCLKSGADDFISKPVNGIELRARVHSMLRIKQQYDDLQALLKLREDMVNMVVHDLRNPLTDILFGLGLLERLNLSPEKQREKISKMQFSCQKLQLLIDDMLLMAKVQSGKLHLNQTETDLCTLIPSILSGFEAIAAQKKLELISKLPELGRNINVDVAMFRRVLDNLISNAIKFSPPDGQIIIYADYLEPDGARIQVADSGLGIPNALRQKIFEKYEIGTLMQDVSQIGLGLAFCKMVIHAHDGEISVKSNQPTGAIFEITLPK